MKELWQVDYGDGCTGEVIKRPIGYRWRIYVKGKDRAVVTGRCFCFVDAIAECYGQHARLALCKIEEWVRL